MVANHSFIRGVHRPAKGTSFGTGHQETSREARIDKFAMGKPLRVGVAKACGPPFRDRDNIRRRRAHVDEQRRARAHSG